jgi:aspartate/methionine/tyrosine aminotransferase
MTGWRVGYGAGPLELIKAMNIVQSQSIASHGVIDVITGPQETKHVPHTIQYWKHDWKQD